ncbi:uncharacterized protein LOC144130398 isoform X2 [Amblyomma americanum]
MFSGSGLLPGGDTLADCTLRTTDGAQFRAHRAFLCTTSPYFQALFGEDYGAPRNVLVAGVKGTALDVLLTFEYTDQLCVNKDTVLDVLEAADMLLLDAAREQCLDLLLRSMCPENCLFLGTLTRRYYCPKFTEAVMRYAHRNFEEVWQRSETFGETPVWLLYDLLASPELNVERETSVLEVIARWFSTASAEQRSKLLELLRCVRIGRCKMEAIEDFERRWPQLADSVEYKDAVTEALKLGPCVCSQDKLLLQLLKPEKPPPQLAPANLVPNPAAAVAQAVGNALFALDPQAAAAALAAAAAFGAVAAGANPEVLVAEGENQDSGVNTPEPVPQTKPMPLTQARCDTCGLINPERWLPRLPSELIFIVGGWSQGRTRSTIEAFDTRVNRSYHGVVLVRRRLYVVGGLKMREYLRTLDSYDLDRCEWRNHSSMNVPRAYVAAAALGEHIYAVGGHTGTERTSSAERYSPHTNQWTMIARMSRRRSDGSACAFKGRLYISGGFNGRQVLESVEEYTPSLDSWCLVRPLLNPRCSHRMVEHGGRIYVIGGYDGRRRLHTVLRSEPGLPLCWRKMPRLNTPRSTFAVAQLGGDLYVIGGFNGTSLISDVERYTPGDICWYRITPLNQPVSALSGCAVTGVELMRKFSARGSQASIHVQPIVLE